MSHVKNSEIFIEGFVGRSYEVSPNNSEVGTFSVAVSNGKDQEPDWYAVQVWSEYLRDLAQSITREDRVLVRGTPSIRKYTNRSGAQSTVVLINAASIGVVPKQNNQAQGTIPRKNTSNIS